MTNSTALATMPDPTQNNVLAPQASIAGRLTPLHEIIWTTVQIDVKNETYDVQGGGKGLHKSALNKIATAAGIRQVSSKPIDVPGMTGPTCLVWQVEVEMDMGGEQPARGIGSKMWQKGVGKDGSDTEHFLSKTETKAYLRAIRAVLGIQSKYPPAAFNKPFAVPHIVYSPDLSDPNVREYAEGRNNDNIKALYGADPQTVDPATLGNDFTEGDDEGDDITDAEIVEEVEPVTVTDSGRTVDAESGEVVADTLSEDERAEVRALMDYKLRISEDRGKTFGQVMRESGSKWFYDAAAYWAKNSGKHSQAEYVDDFTTITVFADLLKRTGA